ncbi:MAG TPA: RDD family protein [Syntrophomonadaceae bacterium]|nr:RDD family protein [Syntrophomonadaceae bacterium]
MIKEINGQNHGALNQSASYHVAGFWIRFGAFLIDLAVIAMSGKILLIVIWPAGLESNMVQSFITINAFFVGAWGAAYLIIMTALWGQTLGKMLLGLRVIQTDGNRPSWQTAVVRELIGRPLSQLFGSNLGYIICAFHPRKQAVHDLISDTYVVYETEPQRGKWVQLASPSENRAG